MPEARSLLIELGTEELPPGSLDAMADAFAAAIRDGLKTAGITLDAAGMRVYCTPRRLAVLLPAVGTEQPEQRIERRGVQ